MSPGSAYLVGERGPEWFVPQTAGAIQANGSGGTVVNMTVVTRDADSFRRNQGQIMSDLYLAANAGRRNL